MFNKSPKTVLLGLGVGAVTLAAVPALAHGRTGHGRDIAPPHGAHAGQCFAKVREADAVVHSREQVMVRPAGTYQRVTPAVTRTVERRVTVSPARMQTISHPAVFRTVWKTITEPGRRYRIDTPARYETVTRRILIEPAHTVWKRSPGRTAYGQSYPGSVTYETTGEVLCRVLIPARFALTTEQELVAPATHRTVQGPPTYRHVSERVQLSPARTERVHHDAVVRTVRETVVVTPAHSVTVRTPPEWRTVDHPRFVPRYGWQPVVCDTPPPPPPPEPRYAPQPYGERG